MTRYAYLMGLSVMTLAACSPQSTPSMMNIERVQLVHQTAIEQIPAEDVDDVALALIADDYRRYGNGPMELAMVYDPRSKSYTAMKARNQLNDIEKRLNQHGIKQVNIRTMAVEQGQAALLVSYDSFQAQGPANCHTMPGVDHHQTTRDIAEYRFGCSTESLLARQVARPTDLMGRGGTNAPADGRRAANVVEELRNYGPENANQPLESFGSGDIGE